MNRSTPWGQAQTAHSLFEGFEIVTTASHGGMMISEVAAKKYLSEAALKRALVKDGYYCYEEDCDINIPFFDASNIREHLIIECTFWNGKSDHEVENDLVMWLSAFHPDYLLEKGVQPNEALQQQWQERNKRIRRGTRKF